MEVQVCSINLYINRELLLFCMVIYINTNYSTAYMSTTIYIIAGGHPREFIQLNKANGQPEGCKYCGLRYAMSHDDHKEHSAQVDATGSNTY